jgi:low temperature requirement protein LtrA
MAYVRRRLTDEVSQRVSTLELFYDLVFVFAITQVSHLLLEHLTWAGAGQALIVLLAVWWSWNYTTWTTNELDTETITVRLLLLALMLVSLLMSVAIPDAFGEHALLFAGSYVAIQVGRHAFLTFAAAQPGTIERERARDPQHSRCHEPCEYPSGANGAMAGRARARLWSAASIVLGTGTVPT